MKTRFTYMWAMILTAVFVSSAFAGFSYVSESSGSEETTETAIGSRGGSTPRKVLLEKFTADWCPPCVSQGHTIKRLEREFGHENLVVLVYHTSGSDEFFVTDTATRPGFYAGGGYYFPTVIIDGGGPYTGDSTDPSPNGAELWDIGGAGSRYGNYNNDRGLIEDELMPSEMSNLTIELSGNITGNTGYVKARITATDPITESNLKVRFMVYQNHNYHRDGNTVENAAGHKRVYDRIVRKVLNEESLPPGFNMGDSVDYYKTFQVGPWNGTEPDSHVTADKRNLGVAVFVQTDNRNMWYHVAYDKDFFNGPVLQAETLDFVEPTVLLVNGDNTDTMDEGFERFEDVMAKKGIPYDLWDTLEIGDNGNQNLRTMPSMGDMVKYGALVWYTGEATTTLSLTDRTNLELYLGAGGSLFITGEDIGQDAQGGGWSSWMLTNLHASFVSDSVPQTTADGILADPITNGLAALDVFDSSPSRISPGMGADQILVYTGTTNTAGLRATHDADSRVVYISFDYFEGTDTYPSDANAEAVMENTVYWLDGVAPPLVQVTRPTAGSLVIRETEYTIEWSAHDVEIAVDGVDIEYSTDSGFTWNPVASGNVNDEAHYWSVPAVSSSDCKVRVCARDSNGQQSCDETGLFRIGTPNFPPEPPLLTGAYLSGGSSDVTLEWVGSADDGGGFNDVVEYDIYTSPTLGGPQSYVGSEPATGAATYSWACMGCGDGDPNTYFFHVWADDGEEVTQSSEVAGKFVRPLSAGWNLVSFPLAPMDTSAGTVLQTVASGRAVYYDAADQADHWKSHDAGQNINDLGTIDRTMGFWLYTPVPDDFVVAGLVPTSTNIDLKKGWNLIGFPSFSTVYTIQNVMSVTDVSEAEAFDPAATPHLLRDISPAGSDLMVTGYGYWMHSTSVDTWIVL
ncbi:MAG: hypothetical protein LN415_04290 [Candidatus Thermoplasmatota archaeon]|nr:hypothetical protein [Candidatus Thermoplasmatota archaeon]